MMKTNENNAPDNLEELLPWHAAGTLNSRDADVVEKALAQDKELARRFAMVREEMTETILLNEALGAPSARVMDNLFKAIDKERKGVRKEATGGIGAWLVELFSPRVLAFSASAAALVILLQAGVITKLVLQDQDAGSYETASAPASATRGIEIGSYPRFDTREYKVMLTLESKDRGMLAAARDHLLAAMEQENLVRIDDGV